MAVYQGLTLTQLSQDAQKNTSQVRILWQSTQTGTSWNGYTRTAYYYISINGGAEEVYSISYTLPQNTTKTILDTTITVNHKDDGSGTIKVRTWMDTDISAGVVEQTESLTLTTIARESTLSAAPADIGATSAITVDRKNAAYTHSIAYRFGSLSGYLASAGGRLSATEVKLSGTSISFPVPESFYAQIPNAPSGDCTLTIRTYSGSTQIGQAQTCVFKVTASPDKCRPVVSGKVVDINQATLALTGDENKLVQGMSTALCTMTALSRYSASLDSRTIGGRPVEGNRREILNMTLAQVEFAATDSRGYTGTDTKAVDLIKYIRLTGNVTAKRTDPTSGNVKLAVDGKYFNGSFGAADNSLTLRYSVDGGEYEPMVAQIGDGEYTAAADLSGLDYLNTHSITVEIKDKLETVTKTVTVGKGIPVFDWGEQDFAFHVPVTAPSFNGVFVKRVEVYAATNFTVQTKFVEFSGVGNDRQSIFLFGNDNHRLIQGVIGINDAGGIGWNGTEGVSITAGEAGVITVTLPTGAYDWFVLISPEYIAL